MDMPSLPKSCAMESIIAHFNVRSGMSIELAHSIAS